MRDARHDSILLPTATGQELWIFPEKGEVVCDGEPTEKKLEACKSLLLALPTKSLFAMPLWVSPEGSPQEIAELELSSRHLLRKNATLQTIPLLNESGRRLLLAVMSVDEGCDLAQISKASAFDVPARLYPAEGADILIWRELGALCFGFYRNGLCVYFGSTGDKNPGPVFSGLLARMAIRLRAEGILSATPARLRMLGDFAQEQGILLGHALRIECEIQKNIPPPVPPESSAGILPPSAQTLAQSRLRFRRIAMAAIFCVCLYAVLLLGVAGDFVWKKIELHRFRAELNSIQVPAAEAGKLIAEWKVVQAGLDPNPSLSTY